MIGTEQNVKTTSNPHLVSSSNLPSSNPHLVSSKSRGVSKREPQHHLMVKHDAEHDEVNKYNINLPLGLHTCHVPTDCSAQARNLEIGIVVPTKQLLHLSSKSLKLLDYQKTKLD